MAITGIHCLLYTSEPEALRATLRDVFGWPYVRADAAEPRTAERGSHVKDAHDGWLIFAMPPSEVGVHPGDHGEHQLSMMCDDIETTMRELAAKGIEFRGEPENQGYGITTTMVLPGGCDVQLYQPRHTTAI